MSVVSIFEYISLMDIGKLRVFRSQDFLTFFFFFSLYMISICGLFYRIQIFCISLLANKGSVEERFLQ